MDISCLEKWHFELSEGPANYLLSLVLQGKKRATASSLWAYQIDGDPLPAEGGMSVLTDWGGTPACVVRTTAVHVLPYREITFDLARLEGEDDCLASWRKNHEQFFTEEGRQLGYVFSEEMPVIFEEFEIVELL